MHTIRPGHPRGCPWPDGVRQAVTNRETLGPSRTLGPGEDLDTKGTKQS